MRSPLSLNYGAIAPFISTWAIASYTRGFLPEQLDGDRLTVKNVANGSGVALIGGEDFNRPVGGDRKRIRHVAL